jgi:hypothetical protein
VPGLQQAPCASVLRHPAWERNRGLLIRLLEVRGKLTRQRQQRARAPEDISAERSAPSSLRGEVAMSAAEPQQRSEGPLDPAVIKLIDALARAQSKEDHDRHIATENPASP